MHIASLKLKNFKRFTDLTIDLSKLLQPPESVLLIGANGKAAFWPNVTWQSV
jgi:predicted ATPase